MSYNYLTIPFAYGDDTLETKWENGVVIGTLPVTGTVKAVQYNHRFSSGGSAARIAAYKTDDNIGYAFLYCYPEDISTTTGRVEFINELEGEPNIIISTNETTSYSPMYSLASCTISYSFMEGMETEFYIHETRQEAWKAVRGLYPPEHVDPEDPSTYSGVVVQVVGVLNDDMDEGGTSNPELPDGEFDDSTTPIDIPSLPPISAAESGLVSLFRPDLSQLQALGRYLWTNISDIPDNLKKLISNPMDCLIALNIVPCVPDVGTPRNVKLGFWETSAQMPPVLNQWYSYYCGGVKIPLYSGTYLDYSPNTKITLMLPFIGSVPLNTDEVMNRTIGVTYHIDLLSGQCVALVTIDDSVYYQFTGECAVSVPLTGADYSRIYSAAVGTLGALVTGGIGAVSLGRAAGAAISASDTAIKGAKAATDAGKAFASVNRSSKGIAGVAAIREGLVSAQSLALESGKAAAQAPTIAARGVKAAQIARTLDNAVSSVMGAKQMVSHSGNLSGAAGMLGVRTPFVTIEYPNQSLPQNYKHFTGYPSNIYARIGSLSGYTECEQVLIENCPCTDDEMSEILEALKGGVYL